MEANPKGYNFLVRVTMGHEAEAQAAQRRKRPSRLGKFILRMLGFQGQVGPEFLEREKSRVRLHHV